MACFMDLGPASCDRRCAHESAVAPHGGSARAADPHSRLDARWQRRFPGNGVQPQDRPDLRSAMVLDHRAKWKWTGWKVMECWRRDGDVRRVEGFQDRRGGR